jgi:hypothetical protein
MRSIFLGLLAAGGLAMAGLTPAGPWVAAIHFACRATNFRA